VSYLLSYLFSALVPSVSQLVIYFVILLLDWLVGQSVDCI
jgi:hypothetical protein